MGGVVLPKLLSNKFGAIHTQESDMSFLTRLTDMLGAIATVKNGSLLFILPGGEVTVGDR
ncbi:phage late control D family protein [Candidatus Erwinia dacicola]|uniref:Phage late control D family protein n=1 Tax=Candidatus Erwinia dacicola TaxID=252393 RepID=A0A328TM76_9GAMM|nr:phage late control D family protein [Candidatus Erwinia dacicola]